MTNTGNRPELPTRVYFERTRASMCVFRYKEWSAEHHFLVNPAQRSVRIWTTWMQKGPLLNFLPGAHSWWRSGRLDVYVCFVCGFLQLFVSPEFLSKGCESDDFKPVL